ncbi:MAG TPA: hypothetical protein PKH80_00430 [Methanofastidiosum sp.]|nr:hypothetical protein [Methanofastidiosum sp.]
MERIVPSLEEVEINELKNSEYLTFIITYIVPFFGFEFNYQTTLSSIILFIIIGCIYIESPLFCINPLLKIIFKYNLYDITFDNKKGYLLSKCNLKLKKQKIKIKNLSYNVYMED